MRRLFFLILFVIVLPVLASAQTTAGTIQGAVRDASEAVMPEVSVKITLTSTGMSQNIVTNKAGIYSFPNLPAGIYQVEFQFTGFDTSVVNQVRVQVGESTRIDAILHPGDLRDTVTVEAAVPVVQADSAAQSTVIDDAQILGLPINGRQFPSLVQLTTGAVTPASGSHLNPRGGFNVAGMDEHYNSSLLDGLDNIDPVIRNILLPPSLEFLQSFQVIESGGKAEFGRNAGAVINAATRSGSNAFHGSAWEYFMNDSMNAKNYFALPGNKPSLLRNQFGGTLSGPIRTNKTFFFAGYEGLRMKSAAVHRATVPTERMRLGDLGEFPGPVVNPFSGTPFANNVIPQSAMNAIAFEALQAYPHANAPGISANRIETADTIQNGNDVTIRLDHALSSQHQLMARFSSSRTRVLDPFHAESGIGSNLAEFGQTADRLRMSAALALTSRIGAHFTNELRAGYSRFHQPQLPSNPGTPSQQPLMGFEKAFLDFIVPPFDTLGSSQIFDRTVNVYNYVDSASYVLGNHQLKVGVDVRRYLFNFFVAGPNTFQFSGSRTGNALGDFLLGLPAVTVSISGSPGGNSRKTELALYAQDDWKVSRRLTLNYGLRWEYFGRITEKTNKQSLWLPSCNCLTVAGTTLPPGLVNNDLNNFAPRIGAAFRPWGSRTVLRASGGIFYDSDMRHNAEVIGNPPFVLNQLFLSNLVPQLTLDQPFPTGAGIPSLNPITFDRNYRDTYAETWNASVQNEILPGTLLDVAYVGSHTLKARRGVNLDQPVNGVLPYPGFSRIIAFEQSGNSIFHSLEIKIERHFTRDLGFTSAYMWGHAIDDRPAQGSASRVQDNYNLRAERADSDFDVRQRETLSGMYRLPFKKFGNWTMSGILTLQTGRPFTVTFNQDWSHTGNFADRPNANSGVSAVPFDPGPNHWINPAAFVVPAPGSFGNLGRNTLRGPGYSTLDVSLMRENRLTESTRLQIRLDAFNVLNHPNFNLPNAVLDPTNPLATPGFGVVTSTAGAERQIQLGLRIAF